MISSSQAQSLSENQTPELDSLIRIQADGKVILFLGKVEIGQGIRTAIAQIAAEELDISLCRIQVAVADTVRSPNSSYTAGSNSIQTAGSLFRQAAADARQILLELAADRLGVQVHHLEVDDGTVKDRTRGVRTTYWEVLRDGKFQRRVTGIGTPKPPERYSIVGRSAPRADLLAKVTGKRWFIQDLALQDMVHGRVVRPPEPNAKLEGVDDRPVRSMPGVLKVVRNGIFLGVVAEREDQAVNALEVLRSLANWQSQTTFPPRETLYDDLLRQPSKSYLVVDGTPVEGPIPPIVPPKKAKKTLSATYYRPYQMHASLGPSAAAAQVKGRKLTVWTHSQGIYPLKGALAQALGMDESNIRVRHVEGAGCYGHNGADDAALDAALLACALPGRPVLLQWMRQDEHAWEPYGSCMMVKMQASLNAAGTVIDWNHDVWSYTHSGRPQPMDRASNLLAAWHLSDPLPPPQAQPGKSAHGGIHRNADPLYAFSRRRIVKHFLEDSPLRVSSLRGLGSFANVFAIESFVDELALVSGVDPIEFRVRHLKDERARSVIQAAAERAGWKSGVKHVGTGFGRGIGFAQYKNEKCYVAIIVELRVDRNTGEIRLERMVIAADAGQIVNPDGVINQLEGGAVQSASWTLKEAVNFDRRGITSIDWEGYPILTFPEAPEMETVLIDQPGEPSLGCGEAAVGPTPAAIANAVFDATGVHLREIPFTPDRVKAAQPKGVNPLR